MNQLVRSRGLYFEEFQTGESVESVGRTITEADIVPDRMTGRSRGFGST